MLPGSAGADAVAALTREVGRACPRSQSEESECLLCTNYQLALQSLAARVMHTSCLWSSPRLARTSRACWLHQRQWVTASGGGAGEDDKGGCCCGCLGDLWRVKGPVMTLCKIYKSNTCNYLRGWTEFTSQTLQQRRQRGALAPSETVIVATSTAGRRSVSRPLVCLCWLTLGGAVQVETICCARRRAADAALSHFRGWP